MTRHVALLSAGLFLGAIRPVPAADRWELASFTNDANSGTHNELIPGVAQTAHDLAGSPDQDWFVFRAKARHSYEARVGSGTVIWTTPLCSGCARFDRVSNVGAILTAGQDDGATHSFQPGTLSVRFIAAASGNEWLRAVGQNNFAAADTYDVLLLDTTYFLPRFNNSASQTTILIVQNATDAAVSGEAYFYSPAGTLLATQPLAIPAQGTAVVNTAGISALAGQAGSAAIAHTGPYGALAGKAVALEPGTGFTFDTALVPIPR